LRILITGANGLLGSELASLCLAKGHETISGYSSAPPSVGIPVPLDITDAVSVNNAFQEHKPNKVFHCAALTDVDRCETEPRLAEKVNARGTANVVEAAKPYRCHIVYVSTDYVFDGARGNYSETDPTNPINAYGRSKLRGEAVVSASGLPHIIARPSVIYGAKPARGKVNFALWLYESLRAGKEVTLLTDQFVSPTLNTSLAAMMLEACERGLTGIYHMSGATRVSRHEFGLRLAEVFGFDRALIKPALMEEFAGRWKARRPKDSSLETSKAAEDLIEKPLFLNHALMELKKEIDGKCSQE